MPSRAPSRGQKYFLPRSPRGQILLRESSNNPFSLFEFSPPYRALIPSTRGKKWEEGENPDRSSAPASAPPPPPPPRAPPRAPPPPPPFRPPPPPPLPRLRRTWGARWPRRRSVWRRLRRLRRLRRTGWAVQLRHRWWRPLRRMGWAVQLRHRWWRPLLLQETQWVRPRVLPGRSDARGT